MVLDNKAAFKTRTAKRVPAEDRWIKEDADDIKWTQRTLKDDVGRARDSGSDGVRDHPFVDIEVNKSIGPPSTTKD